MLFWHDLFSVIIVVWIDVDAWYHEWHCYEYRHIQFMLFWHGLYAVIFSWRWPTHDDDVVNGKYYHLITHVILTWIVLLWLHWLILLHDIMNYIVVNIIRYNSCHFDMNCVMNCWNYRLTTHLFLTLIVWCGIKAFYVFSLFAFVVINCVCNGDVLRELFNTCHAVI